MSFSGLPSLFWDLLNFPLQDEINCAKLADLAVYEDSLRLYNVLHLLRLFEAVFRDTHK